VIRARNLSFAYDADPLVRDFSTTVLRGDKIGMIGPNGSGKTTLLRLLLGQLNPNSGSVEHGTSLKVAYFDQHRAQLDENRSVLENLGAADTIRIGGKQRHVYGYLEDFLFTPERARQPVSALSGGERNRLLLAKMFTRPANVLVLDEPTNDLDTETLELLEALLVEFEGTVLTVSHDRRFLDNLCTSTLVFEGDGVVGEYVGGYSDWQRMTAGSGAEAAPRRTAATPASRPRTRSKRLSFKERKELEALPDRIAGLEEELEALHARMGAADFFKEPPEVIRSARDRAALIPDEIDAAMDRWAELEERA
jgi:ATP-binding cassette subfamily F protein uup